MFAVRVLMSVLPTPNNSHQINKPDERFHLNIIFGWFLIFSGVSGYVGRKPNQKMGKSTGTDVFNPTTVYFKS